jgi:SAM-dependent methyltransferase
MVGSTVELRPHPAKFSDAILEVLQRVLEAESSRQQRHLRVLDPMAGTGRIHELVGDWTTVGIELEPEWAAYHPQTLVGDARMLPFSNDSFDVAMSSPAYANRMADSHEAKDVYKTGPKAGQLTERITYRHKLGRRLSPGNGGGLQWGAAYRRLHDRILAEMVRVTVPDGLVVINVSNHIRNHQEVDVAGWWHGAMKHTGLLVPEQDIKVPTPRMRYGQNHALRVTYEWIFVMRRRGGAFEHHRHLAEVG